MRRLKECAIPLSIGWPMPQSKKAAFLSSLGAGLEYYDFIIYSLMTPYLSFLFFNETSSSLAQIKTFSLFAIGYMIRPIGGIIFGMIGDTQGRKKTFLWVMSLMAGSTFAIGLLPSYSQWGFMAPCLLLLLRILQGLSYGAELPGAITVVCEHVEKKQHGQYSSFVISSVGLGSLLASVVLYFLTYFMTQEQILAGGWRIPFLLGGILGGVNVLIRRYLTETPVFSQYLLEKPAFLVKTPLKRLWQDHKAALGVGIGMTWGLAYAVIFFLYLPVYLSQGYHFAMKDIYSDMTLALLWSALTLPFAGKLADRLGKKRIFFISCLVFIGGILGFFLVLQLRPQPEILIALMLFYQTMIGLISAGYFPLLASLFPTAVRYTGIAICYNLTYSCMGCLPLLLSIFLLKPSYALLGWLGLGGSLLISTISLMYFPGESHALVTKVRDYAESVSKFSFGQAESSRD